MWTVGAGAADWTIGGLEPVRCPFWYGTDNRDPCVKGTLRSNRLEQKAAPIYWAAAPADCVRMQCKQRSSKIEVEKLQARYDGVLSVLIVWAFTVSICAISKIIDQFLYFVASQPKQ
jgi:hypothetical protein